MERGIIPVDPRHIARGIRAAMQGNAIRALVELITNSDDSYKRLDDQGHEVDGIIEVCYRKEGFRCAFAVRDFAEGMSHEEMKSRLISYGAATSGLMSGKRVRGYFGQGAKDALAGMSSGRLCSFKDGMFTECRIFLEKGKACYELDESVEADTARRAEHGIPDNGTIAYFAADPHETGRVPRFDSVHEELSKNCHLRKVMADRCRKVILVDERTGQRRRLRYREPDGAEVLVESFLLQIAPYGEVQIHISVKRAKAGELTQSGDDRDGGLLLVDEEQAVLGISLFRYDNEPLASRLFGEVVIGGFRRLLAAEEPVLREERDGLDHRHPFCQGLIAQIEKRLEKVVAEERLRRNREEQSKIGREEATRYRTAFRILNNIAEAEAPDAINLGSQGAPEDIPPPNGMCLYPQSAQITVGKRYNFDLRIDTRSVSHGSVISLQTNTTKIRLFTPKVVVPSDVEGRVVSKHITIEGQEPNIEGVLRAQVEGRSSEAKVYVVPEKELVLSEGLVFQPETLNLRPGQPRTVHLLVYVKILEGGSAIRIACDNPTVQVSTDSIVVNESEAVRHFIKYPVEVWGEGDGQQACITAECGTHMALLDVNIRSKPDEE
jgi:hypothetical protein